MERTEEKYLYADKEEQLKRANQFLTIGFIVFYVSVLCVAVTACVRGIRSVGYTGMLALVIVAITVVTVIMFLRNRSSGKIRYFATIGLLFVTFFMAWAFDNYYVRFMAAIPLVGCILFYDKKFSAISGIAFSALNLFVVAMKTAVLHLYEGEDAVDQWCATLAIMLMMFLVYYTVLVAQKFNQDTIGSLTEKEEAQQKMVNDVIAVANEVRRGTENAMDIVTELNSSTEVVNGAMKDISDSTQSTAENIQTQTEMTQNIQDSIGMTLERSEKMVEVAKQSSELNDKSARIMGDLRQQSQVIAETNSEVVESMKALRKARMRRGEAGRGFAVVADEIRQLAEKTRQETENIANILSELSDNAQAAAGAVERSVMAAGAQDEMIAQVSESFGDMNTNVNELISDIGEIDRMLNGLSEANNQIVENIMHLSATTEEVTASSIQAADLSVQNLGNAENTKNLLDNVLGVSYQLDKYIKE